MKTYYEIKTVDQSVLDVDTTARKVKTVLNRANYKDFDQDVIAPSAFTKTISERGPQAKNLIWHLVDHNPSMKSAIGKFSEIYMEGDNLVGVTNIPNTTLGNDMLEHYKVGNVNQHSIGFKSIQAEKQKDAQFGDYNLIKEVFLYEGSAVLWGANDQTPTLSVGKSLTKQEIADEYEKCIQDMGKISKSLRTANFSDESCELMELKLTQIQGKMQMLREQLLATQAEVKTSPEPESAKVDYAAIIDNYLKNI